MRYLFPALVFSLVALGVTIAAHRFGLLSNAEGVV
jgi:hypothetical protein